MVPASPEAPVNERELYKELVAMTWLSIDL